MDQLDASDAVPSGTRRRRLLLISNSTLHGSGYLDHAEAEIRDFLPPGIHVLFVPFALKDRETYTADARRRFFAMGYDLDSVTASSEAPRAVENAAALFVGGGNTFRLLKALQDLKLLFPIRRRVQEEMPYIGSSAGSVVACPTIKTTNDMPIVQPRSLEALELVSFQINAHYLDPDPASTHMGETREERLRQFHEENDTPVVGLREGAMLRIERASILLTGIAAARIFRRGLPPVETAPGSRLDSLLARAGR